MHGRKINHS